MRDPEGRRRAIVAGAVEVIAEVGLASATHRAIAARAGVPLGSTTYYFPTLADLLAEALEAWAQTVRDEVALWGQALHAAADVPTALAQLAVDYLVDRPKAVREYELYVLAARDPRLRGAARVWIDGVRDVLSPLTGAPAAAALVALVDGAMLQATVSGEELDAPALCAAAARLL